MSKLIDRFCREHPEMIGKLGWWYEGDDGYWVDLAYPYSFEGCVTVHEWTVADTMDSLKKRVRKLSREQYLKDHGWVPEGEQA